MAFDSDSIGQIAQWAIWGVLMAAIMGWLASQRMRPDNESPAGHLRHPVGILVVGVVGALFFSALAVMSVVFDNGTSAWWVTALFIALAIPSALIAVEYYSVHHECSSNGLAYARLFGQGGFIGWQNVSAIRYSDAMKWFRITGTNGEVARVSAMQKGLPYFAQLVLEHVHSPAIDDNTLTVLQETAAGNPPSIW